MKKITCFFSPGSMKKRPLSGSFFPIKDSTIIDESVDSYHAALWSSLALLGIGANSPLVMGNVGWQESRIAIFKQAVDTRNLKEMEDAIIPRVHFDKKYIDSWLDLFEDNSYYSPILPETRDTDRKALYHFNMHNGTIWRWVRPILGVSEGRYHLRLELRVSPSGPTKIDTLANMFFSIGLMEGLRKAGNLTQVPFEQLEQDFYRVAREGLSVPITWCDGETGSLRDILLSKTIPLAAKGLGNLGIVKYDKWLNIIEGRVTGGRTGSDWILRFWQGSKVTGSLVKAYLDHANQNIPVHEWPDPST